MFSHCLLYSKLGFVLLELLCRIWKYVSHKSPKCSYIAKVSGRSTQIVYTFKLLLKLVGRVELYASIVHNKNSKTYNGMLNNRLAKCFALDK